MARSVIEQAKKLVLIKEKCFEEYKPCTGVMEDDVRTMYQVTIVVFYMRTYVVPKMAQSYNHNLNIKTHSYSTE